MKMKNFTTDSQLKSIILPQNAKELIIKDEKHTQHNSKNSPK
ncbi:hypothetical protein [Campylobacter lanienae]|nr:hypothetical protein [Campylobacter lanienae]